jgi:prepilin-type N-terminal cleavage/methylation domain-containing protein
MKKIYVKYKKGFTLIELILVLVAISALSTYAIKSYNQSQFNSAVVEFQDTVVEIIDTGLLSPDGYLKGNIGENNCSSVTDNGYIGITTERLYNCMEWNMPLSYPRFNYHSGTDTIAGRGLMDHYNGCRIQVDDVIGIENQFDVFINCSSVDEDESRRLYHVEDAVNYVFKRTFAGRTIKINSDARSISDLRTSESNIEESNGDGMTGARLQL